MVVEPKPWAQWWASRGRIDRVRSGSRDRKQSRRSRTLERLNVDERDEKPEIALTVQEREATERVPTRR